MRQPRSGEEGAASPETPLDSPEMLTVKQVAELLQVSERTVRKWVLDEQMPYVRLPMPIGMRVVRRDLLRWIDGYRLALENPVEASVENPWGIPPRSPEIAPDDLPLLTVREAAQLLAVNERKVRYWLRSSLLPRVRLPMRRGTRFVRRDLLRWTPPPPSRSGGRGGRTHLTPQPKVRTYMLVDGAPVFRGDR